MIATITAHVTGKSAFLTEEGGRSVTITAQPGEDIRKAVIDHVWKVARRQGAATVLLTTGDLGDYSLRVSPDRTLSQTISDTAADILPSPDEDSSTGEGRAHARRILTQAWTEPRVVTVLSFTDTDTAATAAMIAATVGYFRGGGVVAWDDHPFPGELSTRTTHEPHGNLEGKLAWQANPNSEAQGNVTDIRPFIHRQNGDRYDVLRGGGGNLDEHTLDFILLTLMKFYPVTVIDAPATDTRRWTRAVAGSTALVVLTGSTPDEIARTNEQLHWVEQHPRAADLARNATIMVTSPPKQKRGTFEKAREALETESRMVVASPIDPALNASQLSYQASRQRTRDVWTDITLRSVVARVEVRS